MSKADKIAYQAHVGPHLQVEVDDHGVIQVAVRSGSTWLEVDTDGWVRADVASVQSLEAALSAAQIFVSAVFPPGNLSPLLKGYSWQQRRDAYLAMVTEGKISSHGARDVTAFLTDYQGAEAMAAEGHRPHMAMEEYVKEWERWW